ncbi:MAG: hypothetical protein NVSMB19_04360 [Vulcanimicrobiaceae bacterium]
MRERRRGVGGFGDSVIGKAYHIALEQNPPSDLPSEPGVPASPPGGPVVDPPLQPPVTDVPAMPIPSPLRL